MVKFLKGLWTQALRGLKEVAALFRIDKCDECGKYALVIVTESEGRDDKPVKLCATCFRGEK